MNEQHDAKLEMYIDKLRSEVERLTAENARLRAALEFYANFYEDGGVKAREALKGGGEG